MLGEIFNTIYPIFNPLPAWFMNFAYPFFFLANIILVVYFFLKNKKQVFEVKKLFNKYALIVLAIIILVSSVNMLFSMNPLNNIPPVGNEIIYQTDNYIEHFQYTQVERSLGMSVLLILTNVFPLENHILMSLVGIILSSLTAMLLYLIIKKHTNNEYISLLLAGIFLITHGVVHNFTSEVSGAALSTFLITLLVLMYSLKHCDTKTIIFTTTLTIFARFENFILVLVFIGYVLFYRKKLNWKYYAFGYLMLIPNIEVGRHWTHYGYPAISFPFGISNIIQRFLSILNLFWFSFALLSILVLVGIFFMRKKILIWIPISLLIFHLSFQQYDSVALRYLVPIHPILFLFIGKGITLFKKEWLQLGLVGLLAFGCNVHFFEMIPDNEFIKDNKDASTLLSGDVALYAYVNIGRLCSRFYENFTIIDMPGEQYSGDVDYLVDISEREYGEELIEKNLQMELTLIEDFGITTVYKVDRVKSYSEYMLNQTLEPVIFREN